MTASPTADHHVALSNVDSKGHEEAQSDQSYVAVCFDPHSAWKQLSADKAEQLLVVRLRRSQLQKLASHHRDDPSFNWSECVRLIVNESLFLAPGYYIVGGRRERWAAANVATALCYGKHAPFSSLAEVPLEILDQCEEGASKALVAGGGRRIRYDGAHMGDALGMTSELRELLKCWMIWPAGWTYADLEARGREKAKERRRKAKLADRDRKTAERRAKGCLPRDKYLASAAVKRLAWQLTGISERTFYRRSEEERAALLDAAWSHLLNQGQDVTSASVGEYNNMISPDEPLTRASSDKRQPTSDKGESAPDKARGPDFLDPSPSNVIAIYRDGDHFRIVVPDSLKKDVA